MYPMTQGSVFERTYQAALRLHNLSKVQTLLLQLLVRAAFLFLSATLPRRCRAQQGAKRMRVAVNGCRRRRTTGSVKNDADRFQKKGERLHVGKKKQKKKEKSGYGTDFYPFRSDKGAYGPFFERNGQNWNGPSIVYR